METFDFTGGSPEEKIKFFFEDYMNKFYDLSYTLEGKGIQAVQDLMKGGHKVMTPEEFIKSGNSTLKDLSLTQDPTFVEKAQKLNPLVERLNALGVAIDEDTLKEILAKANAIVYSQ